MSNSQQLFGWYITGVSGFVHGLMYMDDVCSDTEVSAAKIVLAREMLKTGRQSYQLLLSPSNLSNRARTLVPELKPLDLTRRQAVRHNAVIWIPFENYIRDGSINFSTFSLFYARHGIPNAVEFFKYVASQNSRLSTSVIYEAVCIALMSVHVAKLLRKDNIKAAYDLLIDRS